MTAETTTWTPCAVCWTVRHTAPPSTQLRDGRAVCDEHAEAGPERGALMQPQSDGRRLHAVPCGSAVGPDHGGLTAGELPTNPEIDESNARAAKQRARLASPLERMDGSGM